MGRRLITAIVVCLMITSIIGPALGDSPEIIQEVKQQKFKVTYSVTYNAINLNEAAEREVQIKQNHPEACKVDIKIKQASASNTISWASAPLTIAEDVGVYYTN